MSINNFPWKEEQDPNLHKADPSEHEGELEHLHIQADTLLEGEGPLELGAELCTRSEG